jgi:PAS domain S-box-containing protein
MKLSTRLILTMLTLVLLTAAVIGTLAYRNVVAIALPRALDRVATHADVVAIMLNSTVLGTLADARTQGRAVAGLVNAINAGSASPDDSIAAERWRARLTSRFVAELKTKPAYYQYRLIGIADGGREIVRVDRAGPGGAIRIVPNAELQTKGDRPYFKAAVRLPAGEVYISQIDFNREHGAIDLPRVPTMRVAAPVFASDGKPFGILIINLDMRPAFAIARNAEHAEHRFYVVNERGDYLVHPDRTREFGFEYGKSIRIQDDFPAFSGILSDAQTKTAVVEDNNGEKFGFGWRSLDIAGGPRITVLEGLSYDNLLSVSAPIRNAILEGVLVAVLCALALAVIMGRSLTRPLMQMTRAVEQFGRGEAMTLPANDRSEIGILAGAFDRMALDMQEKTVALSKEVAERRRLFDTSLDLILVTDRQGTFVRVSPSSEAILGYRPDEMTGQSASHFIYPDDLDPTRDEMRAGRRGRHMRNFETRYVHKNRDIVPLQWSGVWSEPEQQHFFIGRDMTEQRRLQDAERKSKDALAAVIDASPTAIICLRASDRTVMVWSRAAEEIFGYTAEETLGRPYMLVPPRLEGEFDHLFQRALAGEKIRNIQVQRRRKDGTLVDISFDAAPMYESGCVSAIAYALVDITERKKAEEALKESEQMARDIIANTLDAFSQLNDSGEIIEWNPQAEAIFGWTREEALGQPATSLFLAGESQPHYPAMIERAQRSPDASVSGERFELNAVRKDGRPIKVEVSLTALRRRDGYVFNGFIQDLTDKIAAEEQLRHAQKMEAVGQLTGGIAHDFNNMLTVITGTIEILSDGLADRPQLQAITRLIGEAADRGAELTGRLLAFARKQPLQPREVDIGAFLLETTKLMRPALGEHIEILCQPSDQVWPALVDPGQLSSAMLNLAINARDAMPNGGRLTLETKNVVLDESYANLNADVRPGNYVMIAISDSGTGIPEEMRDKIFEPFFSTKPAGQGTGLGLSMVYGFIKQSNGHIKIYSEAGQGTTFRLYLPQAGAAAADQSAEVEADVHYESNNESILVVEDDPLVREYVITQLHSLGYRTIAADGATEALRIVDAGAEFDLLFTDVIMPGPMNGPLLAKEVAKRRSPLKVLYTSGYTENAIIHHGRLDPGVLLLAKPYRKSELARMLRIALAAAGAETTKGRKSRAG